MNSSQQQCTDPADVIRSQILKKNLGQQIQPLQQPQKPSAPVDMNGSRSGQADTVIDSVRQAIRAKSRGL